MTEASTSASSRLVGVRNSISSSPTTRRAQLATPQARSSGSPIAISPSPTGVGSSAAAGSVDVQWLILEDIGRRDMTILARHSLRYILQFLGCKATRWHAAVTRVVDDLFPPELIPSAFPPGATSCSSATLMDSSSSYFSFASSSPTGNVDAAAAGTPSCAQHGHLGPSSSASSSPTRLFRASVGITIREQWSRSLLQPITTCDELQAHRRRNESAGDAGREHEEITVLLVPKVRFFDALSRVLATELRSEFQTSFIHRRISVTMNIVRRKQPLVIFCGGTSGCGKSTMANLFASRLGIPTVISTDAVREMLRKQCSESEYPELFASTYQAHERVLPDDPRYAGLDEQGRVIRAFEEHSRPVLRVLDTLIDGFIARSEPVMVEGVHLVTSYMLEKARSLVLHDVPVVPVLVYISNKSKHKERFAIRSKSMTLLPAKNKYVKHFEHIRLIQDHLVTLANTVTGFLLVDNTNVDRSVNALHCYLLECLENYQSVSVVNEGGYLPSHRGRQLVSGKAVLSRIRQWREDKRSRRARSALADSRPASLLQQRSAHSSSGDDADGHGSGSEEGDMRKELLPETSGKHPHASQVSRKSPPLSPPFSSSAQGNVSMGGSTSSARLLAAAAGSSRARHMAAVPPHRGVRSGVPAERVPAQTQTRSGPLVRSLPPARVHQKRHSNDQTSASLDEDDCPSIVGS